MLDELTEAVKKFYLENGIAAGLKKKTTINDIVQTKIHDCDVLNTTPIDKCCQDLAGQYPNYKWENINYLFFPNYIIEALLFERKWANIQQKYFLQITISLLSDYYTVFFRDEYRFFDKDSESSVLAMYSLFSIQQNRHEFTVDQLDRTKAIINEYFPKKRYLPHDYAMLTLVPGYIPYNEEDLPLQKEYSFYDLLFHCFCKADHKILP